MLSWHKSSEFNNLTFDKCVIYFDRMFSFGEFKQEDQDTMLAALNKKVAEVYGACIGQNEANIRSVMQ